MVRGAASRLRPPRGRAADGALAVGVFTLSAVGSLPFFMGAREEPWPTTVLGWTLMAAVCGALYLRRRYPVPGTRWPSPRPCWQAAPRTT